MDSVLVEFARSGLLFDCLAVWPLTHICRRVGMSPWWAALVFVPMAGLMLAVAVLALGRWPLLPRLPKPPRKARRVAA